MVLNENALYPMYSTLRLLNGKDLYSNRRIHTLVFPTNLSSPPPEKSAAVAPPASSSRAP
jgi:hypothetical protein